MESIPVVIGVGLLVSLLVTEVLGLSAGGMVVPGYLALYLDRPQCIVATLVAALLTCVVVRVVSSVAIVYGRRRTVITLVMGFLFGALLRAVADCAGCETLSIVGLEQLDVVGYVIPGLLAIWIERQGLLETVGVSLTSSALVRLVLLAVGTGVLS